MEKLDEINKLGPREKLARLKELEKKNKEEIEQARKMIEVSEREVEIEDEMKIIPIPEVKAVNIDELFSAEAKEIFKAKRFVQEKRPQAEEETPKEKRLEETVREEARPFSDKNQVQYGLGLEQAKSMAERLAESYDTIKSLVQKREEAEYLTTSEQNRLESYGEMAKSLYENKFMPEKEIERDKMLAAERMLYDARLK